jgi:hypothetical protein
MLIASFELLVVGDEDRIDADLFKFALPMWDDDLRADDSNRLA